MRYQSRYSRKFPVWTGRGRMSQDNVATRPDNWCVAVAVGNYLAADDDNLGSVSLPHGNLMATGTLMPEGGYSICLRRGSNPLIHQVITQESPSGPYKHIRRAQLSKTGSETKIDEVIGDTECHLTVAYRPWSESQSRQWRNAMRERCGRQDFPYLAGIYIMPGDCRVEFASLTLEKYLKTTNMLAVTSLPENGILVAQAVFLRT